MTKSTGKYVKRGTKFMLGETFGRLTVVGPIGNGVVPCQCSCGSLTDVHRNNLGRSTLSCGCLKIENGHTKTLTHGMSGTPEYRSWAAMIQRCTNPNDESWANYGGCGITVCDEWLDSFERFFSDMGSRPEGKSLERKDNDGPYDADNCIWASSRAQARNRRSNLFFTYQGETLTLKKWSTKLGITYSAFHARVTRLGMSFENAVALGPSKYGRSKKGKI